MEYNIKTLEDVSLDYDLITDLKRIQHIFIKNGYFIDLLECEKLWIDISKSVTPTRKNKISYLVLSDLDLELSKIIIDFIGKDNLPKSKKVKIDNRLSSDKIADGELVMRNPNFFGVDGSTTSDPRF